VVEAAQLAAWRAATDAARVPDDLPQAFYLAGLDRGRARVLVVPEWEMIVVRLATDDDPPDAERVMQTFLRRLGMAVAPLTEGP
jgi:hypothetical protein